MPSAALPGQRRRSGSRRSAPRTRHGSSSARPSCRRPATGPPPATVPRRRRASRGHAAVAPVGTATVDVPGVGVAAVGAADPPRTAARATGTPATTTAAATAAAISWFRRRSRLRSTGSEVDVGRTADRRGTLGEHLPQQLLGQIWSSLGSRPVRAQRCAVRVDRLLQLPQPARGLALHRADRAIEDAGRSRPRTGPPSSAAPAQPGSAAAAAAPPARPRPAPPARPIVRAGRARGLGPRTSRPGFRRHQERRSLTMIRRTYASGSPAAVTRAQCR